METRVAAPTQPGVPNAQTWCYRPPAPVRKIRCHYPSAEAFVAALEPEGSAKCLQVFTTDSFEPGEELMAEVYFSGLPGKMMLRAIGKAWHAARPRLRVRAGGVVTCTGTEWDKLSFLRRVADGSVPLSARRKHVRLPVLVEIRWRRDGETEFITSAMSEISEGGALLLTEETLTADEEIVLEVMPPGSARPLEIQAIVRNTSNPEGLGLEFVARDVGGVHRLREVIRRLVEQ